MAAGQCDIDRTESKATFDTLEMHNLLNRRTAEDEAEAADLRRQIVDYERDIEKLRTMAGKTPAQYVLARPNERNEARYILDEMLNARVGNKPDKSQTQHDQIGEDKK